MGGARAAFGRARAHGAAADASQVRRAATAAIAQATNTIGVALARSGQLDAAASASSAVPPRRAIWDCSTSRAAPPISGSLQFRRTERAIEVSLAGLELASKIGALSLSRIYANLAAAYAR